MSPITSSGVLDVALAYQAAGRSVLPIAPGEKRPSILTPHGEVIGITWDTYQTTRADEAQIRAWFPPDRLMGIGIACGPVSGTTLDGVSYGLEILDVDDEATLEAFIEAANWQGHSDLLARLVHQRTPGGAGHCAYVCAQWAGNTKLAQRQEGVDAHGKPQIITLIETRGEGGQAVVAPTPPGIHPEHPEHGYVLVRGSWEDVPMITPEERQALWDLARSFNAYVEPAQVYAPRGAGKASASSNRPGDWLNRTVDQDWWRTLLERHDWTLVQERRGIQYWCRPGKDAAQAWSATLGACGAYFYVFSSNASPFQPEKAYLPFAAYGFLEHHGDFQAAARALLPQRFAAEWPDETVALALLERLLSTPEARLVHEALPTLTALSPDAWQATKSAIKRLVGNTINLSDLHTAWKKTRRPQTPHTPPNGTHPPEARPLAASDDGSLPYSDYTNALTLVRDYGQDLRYCEPWKQWLTWRATHWQQDQSGAVMRSAKQTVKRLARHVEDIDDYSAAKALLAHVKKSLSTAALKAMIDNAWSELGIPVLPEDLDTKAWLLNCTNGTLDLQTGILRPHDRTDLLTRCISVAYDPEAACPTWEKFLWRIMGGTVTPEDPDRTMGELEARQQADIRARALIDFLQRAIGHSLTGDTREQCLFIFWGRGANGKSTLVNTLLTLLGPYAMKATAALLMVTRNDRHPTERADLFGTRFVAAIETEEGGRLNEVFVKEATGGDPIRARRMREDFWQFDPTHKVFLATNHKPVIRGTDHAIWRRIKLVPFTIVLPDTEQDKQLPAKLHAELPGILAWAVRGCLAWQQNGLGEPDAVTKATAGYREEMDVFEGFLRDECHRLPGAQGKASELYDAYERWCNANDVEALSKRTFGLRLADSGFTPEKGTAGIRIWKGIGLPAKEEDVKRSGA